MAEDGRIYEKDAISAHIKNSTNFIKSPVTNMPMGSSLHPSHQFKNIIETSIENGDVPNDLASVWLQKRSEKNQIDVWKREALNGNTESAANLALCYHFGTHGMDQDYNEGIPWWKIAAAGGSLLGMQVYGDHLTKWCTLDPVTNLYTTPSPDDHVYGTALLYEAAAGGSACACLTLGMTYSGYGTNTYLQLPRNKGFAQRWLQKGLDSSACVQLAIGPTNEYRDHCAAVLAALPDLQF
jgi:TPR repeat protein